MVTQQEHVHEPRHNHKHGPHSQAAAQMREAALKFLETLSADQKTRAAFQYMDGERIFWYYPPMNRHGLMLLDMEPAQREAAYALMASGLSQRANEQAKLIIDHEMVLGPLEIEEKVVTYERNPLRYSWTIFGDPAGTEPWGWRVEGHHVSLHYSIWGDDVIAVTPFFFGSNPAEVRKGPKQGLRILADRQDLAMELMESMDSGQRSKAIIYDEAPLDILTFNASRASLPKEQGLPASQMSGTQMEVLTALVTEYITKVRSDLSQQRLADVLQDGGPGGGLGNIHLAWGGPIDRTKPHYYRLHGGDFVVEYDNRQNGANHIHSVWRDVNNDFANDVLRDHLILYHSL